LFFIRSSRRFCQALSDLAGGESHVDFPAFLAATAESAAQVLRRIVPVL